MEPHFQPVSVMVYGRIQDICCAETLRCVLLPYYLAHLNAYYEVYNLTFHFKTAFFKNFHHQLFSHFQFSSVAQSYPTLGPHERQHTRLPWPSPIPGACSDSCPLSRWCHPTISSSVIPISSYLQSFPVSTSFPMSQFFASGGQSTGVSALPSVLPMNIQDWFPLGLCGLISLQSKGLWRVFLNTTDQTHQFFGAQLSL